MRIIMFVIVVSAFLFNSGCATSGSINSDAQFHPDNKTIFLSRHFTGYEERHLGEVVRTFEKYGFDFTHERDEANYYLDYSIDAGAMARVTIALLENGQQVLEVKASNAGWGTVIARPAAISSRVTAATKRLDRLLSQSH